MQYQEYAESATLLSDVSSVREKVRAHQHLSSVPLFVFAAFVGVGHLVTDIPGVGESLDGSPDWVVGEGLWGIPPLTMIVVIPLVLAGVSCFQWWRARELGVAPVGGRVAFWLRIGVPMVLLCVPFVLDTVPSAAVAAGIAAAALYQRNRFLTIWSVFLGAVAALLDTQFWTGMVHDLAYWMSDYSDPRHGYERYHHWIAVAVVVGLVTAVGFAAWRRERA